MDSAMDSKNLIDMPHRRDPKYREITAEGLVHRFSNDPNWVVITFFHEDRIITSETMELLNPETGEYKSTKINEEPIRLDTVSVRIPVQQLLLTAYSIMGTVNPAFIDQYTNAQEMKSEKTDISGDK